MIVTDDAAGVASTDANAWLEPDDRLEQGTHALFAGDAGGLTIGQRRALVVLMKNRFITAASHPEEWKALVVDPVAVQARLNDMFLSLRIDVERQVAFKEQVSPEVGPRFPTLLHATEWSREETIALVHLRSLTYASQSVGEERTFVDRVDLLEHVASLRPAQATDRARDGDRTTRALERLVSAGVLIGRKDAERFEVCRALDVILPLEKLQHLLTWIRAGGVPTDAEAVPDGPLPVLDQPTDGADA
jgi:hypothetical protein